MYTNHGNPEVVVLVMKRSGRLVALFGYCIVVFGFLFEKIIQCAVFKKFADNFGTFQQ